uniref:J domain-containing protein n=1 Tax=Pyrodinium bahamense TaxID=73915 RepID=A0A7S0FKB9_9DINO|mmetsp:Transcript_35502/g.98224  ORF Transcript_35502/g.98224 Transcript_35502/m.98224 type:complete len:654 (+) Transcript_35502:341-2302(+)
MAVRSCCLTPSSLEPCMASDLSGGSRYPGKAPTSVRGPVNGGRGPSERSMATGPFQPLSRSSTSSALAACCQLSASASGGVGATCCRERMRWISAASSSGQTSGSSTVSPPPSSTVENALELALGPGPIALVLEPLVPAPPVQPLAPAQLTTGQPAGAAAPPPPPLLPLLLLDRPPSTRAFIEELLNQAFGGGEGGFQFQMGDGGVFGGGGDDSHEGGEPLPWPPGVPTEIAENMAWMKGTEWNWNDARPVRFERDGSFNAPTPDCQAGMCLWSAARGKVYINWGDMGVFEVHVEGSLPRQQSAAQMRGLRMSGRRVRDNKECEASFIRIFDDGREVAQEGEPGERDPYGALGLTDEADDADIKKAYRKLSVKYHPDKNPDEASKQKFNEIRDAYELLSDPDKKILYDTGGMEAVQRAEQGQVRKGDDLNREMDVRLEDLYSGGFVKNRVTRRVVCRGCRRKSGSPKCVGCGRCPNEVQTVHVQVGPGMFMEQQQEVPSKERCRQEEAVLDVQIERGMRDGEQVTFPRMAGQRPGMLPGSVLVRLRVARHAKFERKGDDLHLTLGVSLREALLGWSRTVRHLDGHRVELSAEGVSRPMQVLRVRGEGMPLRDDPASFGDLYVKVRVDFPRALTEDQEGAIAGVLPPEPPSAEL